jgi:hypothetical protein
MNGLNWTQNIPHERNMFHICALRDIYSAVMYQQMHTDKNFYRKLMFS